MPRPGLVSAAAPQAMGSGARGSALALVTDEVLHLIGKLQPLLIGLNLPDEVESCRQLRVCACCDGAVHPISRHYTRSDRVQCSLTGAVLLNGCNAPSVACRVSCGASCMESACGPLRSFPTTSHVISLSTFQLLEYCRWNCNVYGLSRKVTEGNYVQLWGEAPRDTCR